jgi:hypothetical protein
LCYWKTHQSAGVLKFSIAIFTKTCRIHSIK